MQKSNNKIFSQKKEGKSLSQTHVKIQMILEGLQKMVIPSLLHTLLDVKCEVVRNGLVIRDLSGRSALLISAARLEPKCFKMLLEFGASAKVFVCALFTTCHMKCLFLFHICVCVCLVYIMDFD